MDYFGNAGRSRRSSRSNRSSQDGDALPMVTVTAPPASEPSTPYRTPYQHSSEIPPLTPTPSRNQLRPQTIGLRRLPSTPAVPPYNPEHGNAGTSEKSEGAGRRRSSSEPQRPHSWAPSPRMGPVGQTPGLAAVPEDKFQLQHTNTQPSIRPTSSVGRLRSATRSALVRQRTTATEEYEPGIVDWLDVIDPEVSALSTLTNVQNSLFVPDLGRLINRRPTYELTRRPTTVTEESHHLSKTNTISRTRSAARSIPEEAEQPEPEEQEAGLRLAGQPTRDRAGSITSVLSNTHYAVLPHGFSLDGWSEEDKWELNDHVRHLLHSRRAKFKRSMRGFGKYIRRPLGFFVTLYATLITLFGLAWVLFLIGWVNVGGRQLYIINVIDNVLVALFAVVGDGLAPFRAVDTYHMCFIAHYHHLTWRLRRERQLPSLPNENDLPAQPANELDIESTAFEQAEVSVLSPKQQERLEHHQAKFSKSHSFYKPHETTTHRAFPLRLLVAVVVLLDFHSIFQITLGSCTWGISYHHRPNALTPTILCCSISCNIAAGITIMVGDRMSRKTEVIEQMSRQALTEEAMSKVKKRKEQRKAEALAVENGELEVPSLAEK